jgi:hypothetical protein
MQIFSRILDRILYSFRELLLYHHDSIEFRAKLFALVIGANESNSECEFDFLSSISRDIYGDAPHRQQTLILIVREYVEKIKLPNGLGVDELIVEIERDLKHKSRFANKINSVQLRRFLRCTRKAENRVYQERIIEFLTKLKEEYTVMKTVGGNF